MDIENHYRNDTPFTRAIILHGRPDYDEYYNIQGDSPSNSHWLPWLQQQLLIRGILTQTPEMLHPYEPRYEVWRQEFTHLPVDEQTLLVGHSCGGGFLLRWLSEGNYRVGRVVLVAPWLDVEGEAGDFFHFALDRQIDRKAVHGIDVLYSTLLMTTHTCKAPRQSSTVSYPSYATINLSTMATSPSARCRHERSQSW